MWVQIIANTYRLNNNNIVTTKVQRDIGFLIPESLSTSNQIQKAWSRALMEIGVIRQTFDYLDQKSFITLYNQTICPHLERGIQVCLPQTKAKSKALDWEQHKATNLGKSLRGLSYEKRRSRLQLFPLAYQHLRGDLLEVFKLLHGITQMDYKYI
jgi:hypothetical protein